MFQGTCGLVHNNDPYLILAPAKVEIISKDPVLYMYHGMLTDNEIHYMQTTVQNELRPSQLVNKTAPEGLVITNERTQSHSWLFEEIFPMLKTLSQRVSKTVGLELINAMSELAKFEEQNDWATTYISSEAYQIGVYSPGGLYLPHHDSMLEEEKSDQEKLYSNDRIATAMFYLSDTFCGGGTAFPALGYVTQPTKGSMAFWYNLYLNGSTDQRFMHGACPAFYGTKWVSNKWIREAGQIFKRPCDTNNLL